MREKSNWKDNWNRVFWNWDKCRKLIINSIEIRLIISIRFNNNNEISNVFTKANSIDNSLNRICSINENKLLDDKKRWKFKANNYNIVDCKFNWCIWEINSFNNINEIKNFIRNANDWWCEFNQNDLKWYNEQCLNAKIENDKQNRKKKNKFDTIWSVMKILNWFYEKFSI